MLNIIIDYSKHNVSKGNIYRDSFSVSTAHGNTKTKFKIVGNLFNYLKETKRCLLYITTSHNYGDGDIFKLEPCHILNATMNFVTSYIVFTRNGELPIDALSEYDIRSHCNSKKFNMCGCVKESIVNKINLFVDHGRTSCARRDSFLQELNIDDLCINAANKLNI